MKIAFHVKCAVCDADMVDSSPDLPMHFFDCPNRCPGSQRIIQDDNTTQEELDREYEHHKQVKNRQ